MRVHVRVRGEGSGGGGAGAPGNSSKGEIPVSKHTPSLCVLYLCPASCVPLPPSWALAPRLWRAISWLGAPGPDSRSPWGRGTVSLAINYAEHGGRAGM